MTWGGIQSLNGAGRVREQQARAGRFLLPIRRDQAGPSAPCSAALPALSGPGWCADMVTLLPAMGLTEREGPPAPGAGLAHPAVR